jgi:Zn-dependent M28 family amino/carboxypeptidase
MPATTVAESINLRTLQLADESAPQRPSFFYVRSGLARAMLGGATLTSLTVGSSGRIIRGQVTFDSERSPARNVVAMIRGTDARLRGQYVALGAHNDHDPVRSVAVDHDSLRAFNIVARPGGAESAIPKVITEEQRTRIRAILDSLRRLRPARLDSIMNGADDDGSGSMAVLEIAEAFSLAKVKPKRSLLFVWHTSEELGLLGSKYYSSHPTVPRDSIVAQLNIDMIGRGGSADMIREVGGQLVYGNPDHLDLIGSRRLSSELGDLIADENRKQKAPLKLDYYLDANGERHQYYCRSDHYMYARYGIPIAFFFDGGHHDYHQVTDEPQYIDYPKYARAVQLVYDVATRIADLDHRLVVDKPRPDPNAACVQ